MGTRAADAVSLTLPAGTTKVTYVFDDLSRQEVAASAGTHTIPTNLNRPQIRELIAA